MIFIALQCAVVGEAQALDCVCAIQTLPENFLSRTMPESLSIPGHSIPGSHFVSDDLSDQYLGSCR